MSTATCVLCGKVMNHCPGPHEYRAEHHPHGLRCGACNVEIVVGMRYVSVPLERLPRWLRAEVTGEGIDSGIPLDKIDVSCCEACAEEANRRTDDDRKDNRR